jgi:hypothetical protein
MIFVNLRGGLGNQLFQLGAALRLTKGDVSSIRLNVEHLGNRAYEINKWIHETNLPPIILRIDSESLSNEGKTYLIKDPESGPYSDQTLLDANIDSALTNVILDGYFQSGINLASLRKHVLLGDGAKLNKVVQLSNEVDTSSCSIHYRVGDYQNIDVQQVLGMVNLSYVDRAISILQDQFDQITIYSEPNDLLQAYSEKKGLVLNVGLSAEDVFSKLLTSETLIICNSSFSLSAAYLSNSIKKLFRPARWSRKYGNDNLTDTLNIDVRFLSNSFYSIS